MGHQFGHFQKVSGIQWISKTGALNKKSLADHSPAAMADSFITCSNDMSVFVWRHFGDRWSFSYIDVVKCFDTSLSYARKQHDKSTQSLKLTSMKVYPTSPLLAVADNKGVLRVFQVTQERAVLVGTHELVKGTELNPKEDGIVDIHITSDE
jgi:hypothetical protein